MRWRIFETAEDMSRAAAEAAAGLMAATAEGGFFSLVLSGGRTPRRFHELLATEHREAVPWSRVHVFWGDERCVPPDDPASNYQMARETLLRDLPVPRAQIHRIPGEYPPEDAAAAYAETIYRVFDGPARFDLTILGLGEDGHTASLFPGGRMDSPDGADVISTLAPEGMPATGRVTLALDAINRSRTVFFLVDGPSKRDVLGAIRRDPAAAAGRYPAARVRAREETVWFSSVDVPLMQS